jgi:multimeric flavodoxin WrbA
MKTTIVVGSPRNNGSSSIIAEKILEGIEENTTSSITNIYCLGNINLKYCIGCKNCYNNGICVIKDDFNIIFNQIINSDYIILISPSYWGDITGQLKVFFDRSTPFCDTNPNRKYIQKNRKGISIAIRTGNNEAENIHIIKTMEHYFSHLKINPVDKLSICGVEKVNDLLIKKDILNTALKIGKNIANDIY